MAGIYKMFGIFRVPPDGRPVTLYNPGSGKSAVIGKIVIMSRWPQREQEGFHSLNIHSTSTVPEKVDYAIHVKPDNTRYYGYSQGVDISTSNGGTRKAFLTTYYANMYGQKLLHSLAEANNIASGAGAYSLFKLMAGGGTITPLIQAPRCDKTLELNQGIPLGPGQQLQAVNGLTDFSSTSYPNSFQPKDIDGRNRYDALVSDYRARACTLQVAVFGQEFPA